MDKNLKETIKVAKGLHKKGFIYFNDSIETKVEPNYQILASIIERINILIDKDIYEAIKDNKEKLIYEMELLTFNEDALILDEDIKFMENIIRSYIDIEDPVLVDDKYYFITKFDKLQEVYEKGLKQINEGKFKNVIF